MHRTITILTCLCVLGVVTGCRTSPPPPTEVRYTSQHRLLRDAIVRLEHSPETGGDAETLRLLKQLEKELADAERRHIESQGKIAELTEEVERLRHAAGFAVDHIEILYFTRTTDKGINLWVTPFDRHNDVVKTAGSFDISLHHPGTWGIRKAGKKVCAWRFAAQEVEHRWEGQLFEGYHLKLAWPQARKPDIKDAVLRVEFTTAEGRSYTATKELSLGE